MEQERRKSATGVLLCAILLAFSVSAEAYALAETTAVDSGEKTEILTKSPIIDRFAFKTNAFEWMITIPNFGVEFDIFDSEYNSMTAGLTAKYNWNTGHKYGSWDASLNPGPPALFNLLDIRPEFRYYYRTKKALPKRKDAKFDIERFLKEKKHPKPWRAHYVGAYLNYANYTIKFGKRGYQGQVVGLGASAGYALPLYEYKRGAIDVELGFSVGLQLATKDVFIHNPDGFIYQNIEDESKGLHMTPFPVVSELRVAFAWRTKSIKNKVKEDTDKRRVKNYYESRVKDDRIKPLQELNKKFYDEYLNNVKSPRELRAIMAKDSLYRAGFAALIKETADQQVAQVATAFPSDMEQHERADIRAYVQELKLQLQELIAKTAVETQKKFDKELALIEAQKKKAAEQAAKEKAQAEAAAAKAEGKPEGKSEGKTEGKPAKKSKEKAEKTE